MDNIVSVVAEKFWQGKTNRLFFLLEWMNPAIRRNNDRWYGPGIDMKTEDIRSRIMTDHVEVVFASRDLA